MDGPTANLIGEFDTRGHDSDPKNSKSDNEPYAKGNDSEANNNRSDNNSDVHGTIPNPNTTTMIGYPIPAATIPIPKNHKSDK